jgi:hypothetical protein
MATVRRRGFEFWYITSGGYSYNIQVPSKKTTYGELKDLISKQTGKEVKHLSDQGHPVDLNDKVDEKRTREIRVTFVNKVPLVPPKIQSLQELLAYAKGKMTTKEDIIKAIEEFIGQQR